MADDLPAHEEPYTPGGPLLHLMDRVWDACTDPGGREPRTGDERARLVWRLVRAQIEDYRAQVRQVAAERDDARTACRSAAVLLRATADRLLAGPRPSPEPLLAAARELGHIADTPTQEPS